MDTGASRGEQHIDRLMSKVDNLNDTISRRHARLEVNMTKQFAELRAKVDHSNEHVEELRDKIEKILGNGEPGIIDNKIEKEFRPLHNEIHKAIWPQIRKLNKYKMRMSILVSLLITEVLVAAWIIDHAIEAAKMAKGIR